MPTTRPWERLLPRALGPRLASAAVAVALAIAGPAYANPNDADDVLARYLSDTGLAARAPDATRPAPASGANDDAVDASPAARLLRSVRDGASELVVQAMGHIGVRYRRGGNTADTGFDCSGFVRHVYNASLGLVLPRRADEQAAAPGFVAVGIEELRPGDLVFFNTLRRTFSHVGIYIGEGRFVHSPRSGEEIRTDKLSTTYWARRFDGARRLQTIALASD